MAKLLVFFETLAYYLPTEADQTNSRGNSLFTGLCTGYAPAPLGEDLSRFKRLLRDMETGRPDEFSRLFSAAKAPGAAGPVRDQDETSAASLFSALHKDAGTNGSIRLKERLWQARLILKLAEMLDRREAEVRQGLARISSAEQNLFASIEGRSQEETDDPDESGGLSQLRQASSVDMLGHEAGPGMTGPLLPLRVKAWAELYLADSSDPPPPILAAAGPESGALLLDGYENTWRRKPDKLFCLAIPPLSPAPPGGGWNNYLAARNNFREAVLDNLEYFAALLKDTALSAGAAPGSRDKVSMLPAYISSWQDRLQDHFPGPAQNSQELEFYSFPGVSLAELLQQLFHLQGPVAANKQERSTGILAILSS